MFKRRTLFVLGAGASHEAGLPCGADLALKISDKLDIQINGSNLAGNGDGSLFQHVANARSNRTRQLLEAAALIRDGIHLSHSIDDFLDLHRENDDLIFLAKATITKCILEAERASSLWYDDSNSYNTINFRDLHSTWYAKFIKLLGKNVPRQNAVSIFENVSFIVFNYDRCLEHFLPHALERLYGLQPDQADSICADATIVHPYGLVAPLRRGSGRGIPFGGDKTNPANLAPNIRTYTEQVAAADTLAEMRQEVERAKCIIFLGCAFHEPNMRMLTTADRVRPVPVFASGLGISEDDADHVRAAVGSLFVDSESRTVRLRTNLKCSDVFDNFSRTLAG
jgi:hypothetical protein